MEYTLSLQGTKDHVKVNLSREFCPGDSFMIFGKACQVLSVDTNYHPIRVTFQEKSHNEPEPKRHSKRRWHPRRANQEIELP